jgi:hypothetical protein
MQTLSATPFAPPPTGLLSAGLALPHLLARASSADISTDPFPHLVIRDAVAEDLYQELEATFPPLEVLAGGAELGSNRRIDRRAVELLRRPEVPAVWQAFAAAHLDRDFLDRFVELFWPYLPAPAPAPRVGVRHQDSHPGCDVLLDFMIAANTPVVDRVSSVRGAHVDLPNKLFTALLYLRDSADDSAGGDLELYRLAPEAPRVYREPQAADFRAESQIPDRFVECVKTVPYDRNVFVIFVNGPQALHGVSPRSVTAWPRRFACAIAQVERGQFEVSALQEGHS